MESSCSSSLFLLLLFTAHRSLVDVHPVSTLASTRIAPTIRLSSSSLELPPLPPILLKLLIPPLPLLPQRPLLRTLLPILASCTRTDPERSGEGRWGLVEDKCARRGVGGMTEGGKDGGWEEGGGGGGGWESGRRECEGVDGKRGGRGGWRGVRFVC